MKKPRTQLLCLFFPAALLFQGCVPVMVSTAISASEQEDAGYTEYLFDAQAQNKALQQAGSPPRPIATEDSWLKNVYLPRLDYALYYSKCLTDNPTATPLGFEVWMETEYPKILAQRAKKPEGPGHAGH